MTEESRFELDIDFEKLYFNMLDAKADYLYTLPEWDDILTEEKRERDRQSSSAVPRPS